MENHLMCTYRLLILTAAICSATAIPNAGPQRAAKRSVSTFAATAVIKRAATENPGAALKTLEEATRLAEQWKDRHALLVVAGIAYGLGEARLKLGDFL